MGTLKEIENRYYKECNVIMLPVKQSNIGYRKDYGLSTLQIRNKPLITSNKNTYQAVELYITSDDEIKEDNYCYDVVNKIVFQFKYFNSGVLHSNNHSQIEENCKKIIATTDKSLKKSIFSHYSQDLMKVAVYKDIYLPQPSQSFIKKFCELGGIDKVLVEQFVTTNNLWNTEKEKYDVTVLKHELKTDNHNTITIKEVKEKMYTESFVLWYSGMEKHKIENAHKRWIKENL